MPRWPSTRTWRAAVIRFAFPRSKRLAKYYEHKERNYSMALEFTMTALSHTDSDALRHREGKTGAEARESSAVARG